MEGKLFLLLIVSLHKNVLHYMKYDMPPAATARLEVFSFLFRDFLEIYLLQ